MNLTLSHYDPLKTLADGWASGTIGTLLVTGSPGSGKSRLFKEIARDRAVIIEGQMSALGFYSQIYRAHCDGKQFLIDDVDGIYDDPRKISILKCLGQTDAQKRITWHTASKYLEENEIPNEFTTTSSVAILSNEWKVRDRNVAAIADRGVAVEFCPSPEELHNHVAGWFQDSEIYDYVGSLLPMIQVPSMRHYVVSAQLKQLGLDWRQALAETIEANREWIVLVEVMNDPSLKTSEERAKAFMSRTGASRATFFRRQNEYKARNS